MSPNPQFPADLVIFAEEFQNFEFFKIIACPYFDYWGIGISRLFLHQSSRKYEKMDFTDVTSIFCPLVTL